MLRIIFYKQYTKSFRCAIIKRKKVGIYMYRSTHVKINLDNIKNNITEITKKYNNYD